MYWSGSHKNFHSPLWTKIDKKPPTLMTETCRLVTSQLTYERSMCSSRSQSDTLIKAEMCVHGDECHSMLVVYDLPYRGESARVFRVNHKVSITWTRTENSYYG